MTDQPSASPSAAATPLRVVPDGPGRHTGTLYCGPTSYPCTLGKTGVTQAKREGDNATPVGRWPVRELLYRPDHLATAPQTALPHRAMTPTDGWCDDPDSPAYNRAVILPYPARAERLWRDDALYDVLVVLGYNDAPPVAGAGSAIFLHVARPDFSGTEGCVGLALDNLLEVVQTLSTDSLLEICAPS